MKLSTLLRRLGLARLAKRAGVTPATVRRWVLHGPSSRGQDALDRIATRLRAAKKGQKTRAKRTAFRATLPIPASPDLVINRPGLGTFSDPTDLVPSRPPVETEQQLRREAMREGYALGGGIDTDSHYGESTWITVGEPLVNVDMDFVGDTVVNVWQQSGRQYVQARFLFFRYIPFNPLYRGEMLAKQGKWHPWWTSTAIAATMLTIASGFLEVAFDEALRSAESRLIWLEGYLVRSFDLKPDAPRDWRERALRQ